MKRENNMSSMFIHFPNASILRSAVLGAVDIPGAYPGQANRTRLIVPGSFPVDVTLSIEEVLVCWKGEQGTEEARRQRTEAEHAEMSQKIKTAKGMLRGLTPDATLADVTALLGAIERVLQ
jgi:hypothetical protein